MTADYILTSIIVILLPGTGVLYTLAFGLGKGMRASLLAALGCTLGIVPHIAASIAGLAAVLHASALAFQVIRYLGVAYLFYMAWAVLRDGSSLDISPRNGETSPGKIIATGFLLNILNPKLSIFFLAFLPQFVPAGRADTAVAMLELGLAFMALTLLIFAGYGLFAAAARRYVIARPRVVLWLRRGFALSFGLLGAKLAVSN